MPPIPYRPDIDGLRALAVLLVVGFHAFPSLLPGGFIGVDLFFVISGYLISSILYQGLSTQNFSFLPFYGKRIRRIFPALIVVLLSCYAFGWFALFADEYALLGKLMASGAGFVANYLLWFEAGYFDSAADTKPLLHLWSLGIEEQFYLIWPLFLWLIYFLKSKYPKARSFTNPFLLTVSIAILSFVLNIRGITVTHDIVATFYSAQTRFWELLLGAILAYCTLFTINPSKLRIKQASLVTHIQSLLGLLLILIGVALITKVSLFPGWWALLPTLGAVLLIHAGPKGLINRYLLSNQGMVWVGLISYPLYLWHWPILSFLRIIESETPAWHYRLVAVVLAFVLATLTYLLIEKPIRYGFKSQSQAAKAKWQQYTTGALVIMMFVVGYVGWNTYEREGYGFRKSISESSRLLNELKRPYSTRGSDGSCSELLGLKIEGDIVCLTKTSSPEILIVGDSHAMALNSAAYLKKISLNTLLISGHGCLPLVGYLLTDAGQRYRSCDKLLGLIENAINKVSSIKKIVIVSRQPFTSEQYFIESLRPSIESQEERFKIGYSKFISLMESKKMNTIFFVDPPALREDPSTCIFKRPLTISSTQISTCIYEKKTVIESQSQYRNYINELKLKHPTLKIYDPIAIFCDENNCYGKRDGHFYYWDGNHITSYASLVILTDMVRRGILNR